MPLRADPQTEYGRHDASPALDDVEKAIKSVDTRESHAFHFRPEIPVRLRAHMQGIARVAQVGEDNWFVMSKHHSDASNAAGLLFVQWPSMQSDGGPFAGASSRGGPGLGRLRRFWGRGQSEHPGGMQLCGHLLAVAQDPLSGPPFISFVNMRDPRNPSFVTRLTLDGSHGEVMPGGVTCVALTRLADQRYLVFVYKYSAKNPRGYRGWFFCSRETFINQNTSFTLQHSFDSTSNSATRWFDACDSMALLNQRDGTIYLVGMRGRATDNHLDVYRLQGDRPELEYRFTQFLRTRPIGATFRAGGCLHITPARELVIYAVEKAGGGSVRNLMVEEFSR